MSNAMDKEKSKAIEAIMNKSRNAIIKEYAKSEKDTGSAEVQVALLTNRILTLSEHMKKNPKDKHSQRGLLVMVGRRRRLIGYVKNRSEDDYKKLIKSLGLRR